MKGMFWVFLGNGIQIVLQIVTLGVLARMISLQDFGLANAAIIVIGLMNLLSLWIGPAIIQRKDLSERHIRTGFTVSLILGVILTALANLLAPAFAGFMNMENLVPIIKIASLIFIIQSVFVIPDALLARNLRFGTQTIVQVVSYLLGYGLVGIVLALMHWGVWALVAATLGQAIIETVLSYIWQPFPKSFMFDEQAFKELFYFGGGLTIAKFCNYLAYNGDNFVVGRWLGEKALGLYSRAFQMISIPSTMFGTVLDTVLFPAMSAIQDSVTRLKAAFRRGVLFIAVVVLPISVLSIILAPEIIRIILGNQWDGAIVPFQILALTMLFRTSYRMSDSLARATGAVYHRAWRQFLFGFFVIFGAWSGSHWGLPGVAWGVFLANIINFLLMAQLSLKLISMSWKEFFDIQFPSLGFALFTFLIIWLAVTLMRSSSVSPILIVLISVFLMGVFLTLVLIKRPFFLLGADGLWALDMLETNFAAFLPSPLRRFLGIVRNAYK
jgi:PST family polysaccharide transporter